MNGSAAAAMITRKKAVLFDLFHTLTALELTDPGGISSAEALGISRDAWNEQLLVKTRERMSGELRDPYVILERMAHAVNPSISTAVIKAVTARRIKRFKGALVNAPGESLAALDALKRMGKKLALVSNAEVSEIMGWDESPLAPFFDAVIFSCDVGAVKPEPEIYQAALDALAVSADDAAFVGDGNCSELKGARNLGITTVMMAGIIRRSAPQRVERLRADADFVIDDLRELAGLVSSGGEAAP
jgi:putative hydrolase of the HAD superfamily